jgi:hypothetical protein
VPSKWFACEDLDLALRYAEDLARTFRVAACVWRITGGRIRLVRRVEAEPARA